MKNKDRRSDYRVILRLLMWLIKDQIFDQFNLLILLTDSYNFKIQLQSHTYKLVQVIAFKFQYQEVSR